MSGTLGRRSRQRAFFVLVLMICLGPVAGPAFAGQAQQEASIIGQVTDTSGAILPGVTVTATSPALQIPQLTNVTNERGEYRLPPLPIGTYAVEYTLTGFQTVRRESIPLTAGFIARVDVMLKVGALAETITVSGAAPVVDVTSTNSPNTLTRDMMELIPTSRAGLQSVLVQAPGTRTNLDLGSGLTANPIFRVFGRNYEAWIEVEGFPTTSPKSVLQSTAQYVDYESFEQTTVSTLANNAESPNAGMNMNIILKSGGNDFHGQGTYTYTNHHFSASNLDANLAQQGIRSGNPIQTRWDADAALGGPIISNKLWFFFSLRGYQEDTQTLRVFQDDGSPAIDPATQLHSTERESYEISPSRK